MRFKEKILKVYTFTLNSPDKTNFYQKIARDAEWKAIKPFLRHGNFLDVGAGAGYAMKKAQDDFGCDVFGVDPIPKGHGVGREGSNFDIELKVKQGFAENLPFKDDLFDIVYSSHVLEHVKDLNKSLTEMHRVCKNDGIVIIGVPTSTMAIINWITQVLLTTHIKIINLLFKRIINTAYVRWWEIFIPCSHSNAKRWIIDDVINYRARRWKKIIENQLKIENCIFPVLYPYPEYLQLFKAITLNSFGSSVFFICKPK